jgi:phage shock protein C
MNERLYRSRDDRVLAGVAGGLAEIWEADPSLIRIVWALLVILTGGIALLVYIVMAIVVPEENDGHQAFYAASGGPRAPGTSSGSGAPAASGSTPGTPAGSAPPMDRRQARRAARTARRATRRERGNGSAGIVIGGVLIVIGVVFLVRQLLPAFDFDWFWPLILVGLGVVLLIAGLARDGGGGPGHAP